MKRIIAALAILCILPMGAAAPSQESSRARKIFDSFGQWLGQKYRLVYLKSGAGALVDSHLVDCSYSFADSRELTIDQARPFIVALIQTFERMTFEEPEFESTIKDLSNVSNKSALNCFGFKISFWDGEMNRIKPPYVAEIRFIDGKIFYRYSNDKDQSLGDPVIETYQQATKIARQSARSKKVN